MLWRWPGDRDADRAGRLSATRSSVVLLDFDRGALDRERLCCPAAAGSAGFELLDVVHSLDDFAEDGVSSVEVRCGHKGDEELAAIGAGSGVGHAEDPRLIVARASAELPIILIARTAGATTEGVSALGHEAVDDSMEGDIIIESELGQIDGAGDVHGRFVGQQFELDGSHVGFNDFLSIS